MKKLDTSLRIIDPYDRRVFSYAEMQRATIDTVRGISAGMVRSSLSGLILISGMIYGIVYLVKRKKGEQRNGK